MWMWLATSFAQTPAMTIGQPAEAVYAVELIASKRFVDGKRGSGVTFEKGKALRVIVRENGWVRVRDGESYGWLPESKLSSEPPAPPALPVELTMPSVPVTP